MNALRRLGTWLFLAAIATAVVFVRTFDHEERASIHTNGSTR